MKERQNIKRKDWRLNLIEKSKMRDLTTKAKAEKGKKKETMEDIKEKVNILKDKINCTS